MHLRVTCSRQLSVAGLAMRRIFAVGRRTRGQVLERDAHKSHLLVGELRLSGRRRVGLVRWSCEATRSHGVDLLAIVHEHELHGVEEQVNVLLVTVRLEGEAWYNFQTT